MKAFGIFSGGLDSILSARLLMEQGISPSLIHFTSPFFTLDPALAGAKALGLPLKTVNVYNEMLDLIKSPPHGHGKHLNPCIDCHALMLRKAGELLDAEGGEGFLFSGEVVGQRPMSQNQRSLKIVAENSGREELILRPLSAKLLNPSKAEEKGWVDRDKLLAISGRGRRAQMDLAKKWGLPIPAPAGGCLLTDAGYCYRFQWLLDLPQGEKKSAWPPQCLAELIKHGRLFSSEKASLVIVGRHQADNKAISELIQPGDYLFHLENAPGPSVLLPLINDEQPSEASLDMARHLAVAYGSHGNSNKNMVRMTIIGSPPEFIETKLSKISDWQENMIKISQ